MDPLQPVKYEAGPGEIKLVLDTSAGTVVDQTSIDLTTQGTLRNFNIKFNIIYEYRN